MQSLPFRQLDEFLLEAVIQETPHTIAVRGFQPSLNRPVFIKLLKPHIRDHSRWVERFRREARICARLKHPNIVDVYTIGEREGYIYMALEFVEGMSLRQLLEKSAPLAPEVALEILHQVLSGLEVAHRQGIIHRDIKPGNILLDTSGAVKITDFGLAYLGEDASLTQEGSILGTPAYMSPEQITGEPLTPASDLFSLGATLYEMLTGVKPFAGENYSACIQKILNETPPPPSHYNNRLPSRIDELVLRLIARYPEERFGEAGEVLEFIKQIEENSAGAGAPDPGVLVRKYYSGAPPLKREEAASPPPEEAPPDTSLSRFKRRMVPVSALLLAIFFLLLVLGYLGRRMKPFSTTTAVDSTTVAAPPAAVQDSTLDTLAQPVPSLQNTPVQKPVAGGEREIPPPATPVSSPEKATGTPVTPAASPGTSLPQKAYLQLEISPWASVQLDGEVVDSLVQRKTFAVTPGTHRLVLTHTQFSPRVFTVTVQAGERKEIRYSFLQQAGYLQVEVRPWADVFVDGQHLDTTPLQFPIALSPGQHLVELKNPYYETVRRMVTISSNDTVVVREVLKKPHM